jgi:OOP family OmpA-OmpF porin
MDLKPYLPESMTMNTTYRLIALAAATLMACTLASAQSMPLEMERGATEVPYLIDSGRVVVRSQHDLCWRTGFWTVQAASTAKVVGQPYPVGCYCDKELMAKATCEPKPVAMVDTPRPAPVMAPAPVPVPVATSDKVTIPADTLFEFDRAEVTPTGKERITQFTQQLKALNLEAVVAVGHADRIGTDKYNQSLSERRAEAIKTLLVSQGVETARVFAEGKGESQPVTGDACKDMGKESGHNRKLVACLAPDRRVVLEAIGTRR